MLTFAFLISTLCAELHSYNKNHSLLEISVFIIKSHLSHIFLQIPDEGIICLGGTICLGGIICLGGTICLDSIISFHFDVIFFSSALPISFQSPYIFPFLPLIIVYNFTTISKHVSQYMSKYMSPIYIKYISQ